MDPEDGQSRRLGRGEWIYVCSEEEEVTITLSWEEDQAAIRERESEGASQGAKGRGRPLKGDVCLAGGASVA